MMKLKKILQILVVVGLIAAMFLGYNRAILDSKNNTVEIAVDFRELTELSNLSGMDLDDLIKELKKAGVTTCVMSEDTVENLTAKNEAIYLTGAELLTLHFTRLSSSTVNDLITKGSLNSSHRYILFFSSSVHQRVFKNLESRYGPSVVKSYDDELIELATIDDDIEIMSLGFDENMAKLIKDNGLNIIAGVRNDQRLKKEGLTTIAENARSLDAKIMVFTGTEILGFSKPSANSEVNIGDVASTLENYDLKAGVIEQIPLDGKGELLEVVGDNFIKVHEVAEWRTEKSRPAEIVNIVETAVRDRGIRVLYLRFFLGGATGETLVERNVNYIEQIHDNIVNVGYEIGEASSPHVEEDILSTILFILIGLGVIAAASLLIFDFIKPQWNLALLILGALCICGLFLLGEKILLSKILALLAACVFPTLAVMSQADEIKKIKVGRQKYISPVVILVKASLITLVGALFVVGLLNKTSFLTGADVFTGVKISYVVPLAAVTLILGYRWGVLKDGLRAIWNKPVLVKYIVMGLLFISAAVLYLIRSGNTFAELVPAFEVTLRRTLEDFMLIRPRFKEFFIGHPALLLSASLFSRKRLAFFLAIAGTIGQVSILNTFCHVYSPLWVSLLRSTNGLLLGIIVGVICLYAYNKFNKVGEKVA